MSFETFSELVLMTRTHFNAWLAAEYVKRISVTAANTDTMAVSSVDSTEMEQKAMF